MDAIQALTQQRLLLQLEYNVEKEAYRRQTEDAGIELEVNGLSSDFHSELPVVRKGQKRVIGNGECKIECNSVCRQLDVKVKK